MKTFSIRFCHFLCLSILVLGCQSTSDKSLESSASPSAVNTGKCSALTPDHKAEAPHAMIVSNGPESTRLGLDVLARGGNAVDAAVVVSLALGVELPEASGIGGGGIMLLSKDQKKTFWDYRERAPLKATANMFDVKSPTDNSQNGPRSIAVPGLVHGLYTIHKKHGKLKWKDLVNPVAELAAKGVPVHSVLALQIPKFAEDLKRDPEMRAIYFDKGGAPLAAGALMKNPAMAKTLRRIAQQGPRAIYKGEFPRGVIKKLGQAGILSLEDFKKYESYEVEPLKSSFGPYTFYAAPSPSSGGIVLAQLAAQLERLAQVKDKATKVHFQSELMKLSYWDRAAYMGDARFVKVPYEKLLSPDYLAAQYSKLKAHETLTLAPPVDDGQDGIDTTHFNIVDKDGIVVSSTQTHNYWFGSRMMYQGITLNDEMDDFSLSPGVANVWGLIGSRKNAIAPGKTPLSSMSPTLIEKDNAFYMAIGGRGGSQIITANFTVLSQIIADSVPAADAIEACRYHHQAFPNVLSTEKAFNPALLERLVKRGHKHEAVDRWYGKVNLIQKTEQGYLGLCDPREGGKALGN